MSQSINVLRYAPGEEAALFKVFYSAIHLVAGRDYTPEQIAAWASEDLNALRWQRKIHEINPFVAEWDG